MSHLFSIALEDSAELIQWNIGDTGFEMTLSGEVPAGSSTRSRRRRCAATLYNGWGAGRDRRWAVHAGGRSILDAVEKGLELPQGALFASRDILARYGNMSSSTLMFVLSELIGAAGRPARASRSPSARASPPRASISSGRWQVRRTSALIVGGGPAGASARRSRWRGAGRCRC